MDLIKASNTTGNQFFSFKNLWILFVFISFAASGQSSRETAHSTIKQLKGGALFVRLSTSQNLINAYIKNGKVKEAEEIRMKKEKENKEIAEAFKKEFHFCKVYFFYSDKSTDVKEGNYSKHLMNSDLQPDSTFMGFYIIGEFDQSKNTGLDAFILKNKNYEQLKSPFPFLIKRNQMLVIAKSTEDIAKQVSEKLNEFYGRQ
ncbi:MAG: hypothetical protein M3R27_01810 [Bacteroidota bacterium]|nr:hypothetical protein [Bacteroidota bacterium]